MLKKILRNCLCALILLVTIKPAHGARKLCLAPTQAKIHELKALIRSGQIDTAPLKNSSDAYFQTCLDLVNTYSDLITRVIATLHIDKVTLPISQDDFKLWVAAEMAINFFDKDIDNPKGYVSSLGDSEPFWLQLIAYDTLWIILRGKVQENGAIPTVLAMAREALRYSTQDWLQTAPNLKSFRYVQTLSSAAVGPAEIKIALRDGPMLLAVTRNYVTVTLDVKIADLSQLKEYLEQRGQPKGSELVLTRGGRELRTDDLKGNLKPQYLILKTVAERSVYEVTLAGLKRGSPEVLGLFKDLREWLQRRS